MSILTSDDRDQGRIVVRALSSAADAEAAVRALHDSGFSTTDISVVVHDPGEADSGSTDTGVGVVTDPDVNMSDDHSGPGGIPVGTTGLVLPGVGIFIGGPLAMAVSESGEEQGGLADVLVRLGVRKDSAREYQERYEAGDILVAVASGVREQEAAQLLDDPSKWAYREELRPIETKGTTSPKRP